MIIWLASYPKSGNTLTRSFLSSYFFSKDGTFSFDLLKNIKQYPHDELFAQLGVNLRDKHEVAKSAGFCLQHGGASRRYAGNLQKHATAFWGVIPRR